ncbi:DUF4245 domain-containing protein [Spelaeicoccus albus]|uniref:DUF4245 domain-containing protein n=1 Tax=Spelaeicoccus albus TaxID=1280376 RepID=A0A7Z0IHV9_9MICO|nr:DUF4245 domain-containing protein [Spelaeicoccus albus]NYI68013.1 hypothetical protein [Spelaeicoccus albus]
MSYRQSAPPQSGQPESPPKLTHRQQQARATTLQLVLALAACFVVLFGVLALVPHKDTGFTPPTIDVSARAKAAAPKADFPLAQAHMKGWKANAVSFKHTGDAGVPTWYVSYLGPDDGWLSVKQAAHAPSGWAADQYGKSVATGNRTVDGVKWKLRTTGSDGNQYMIGKVDGITYVLMGQADLPQFDTFAKDLLASVK